MKNTKCILMLPSVNILEKERNARTQDFALIEVLPDYAQHLTS